jgi:hypothetical protein
VLINWKETMVGAKAKKVGVIGDHVEKIYTTTHTLYNILYSIQRYRYTS